VTSSSVRHIPVSLLLCTDGLASYPKQALKVFSKPLRTGKVGRPRLLLPEGLMVAQAIKRYARRQVIGILRRVVRGTEEALEARLVCTQGGESAVINTAYIERLQATLRSRLAPLARRTRAAARHWRTLEAGMWLGAPAVALGHDVRPPRRLALPIIW
jgi:hypothetical protein